MKCRYFHFHSDSSFAVVRICWWVGRFGAFPLLGWISLRQNVKLTKIYQQKATWSLSPVQWPQIMWCWGRRKENLFPSRIAIQNRPSEFASPHDVGHHLGLISCRDNIFKALQDNVPRAMCCFISCRKTLSCRLRRLVYSNKSAMLAALGLDWG